MKRVFAVLSIAVLVACGRQREAELDARETQLNKQEHILDSIRIVENTRNHGVAPVAATNSPSTNPSAAATPEKKKLSNKAKGAIIGAGVGAITGAVVDRNHRGRGAVIGGVVGAGTGFGAGAIIDKKKEEQ